MKFLKHLIRLIKDLFAFAGENKAWWMIPVVLLLLMFAALIVVTQAGAPAFIYTLF
jgi:hypothetical protein